METQIISLSKIIIHRQHCGIVDSQRTAPTYQNTLPPLPSIANLNAVSWKTKLIISQPCPFQDMHRQHRALGDSQRTTPTYQNMLRNCQVFRTLQHGSSRRIASSFLFCPPNVPISSTSSGSLHQHVCQENRELDK